MSDQRTFTVLLDEATRAQLDALGTASDRSTGSIVRLALRGFLDAAERADLSRPLVNDNDRAAVKVAA